MSNTPQNLTPDYPLLTFKDFTFNVETFEHSGAEDEDTDDFRDYIRKQINLYRSRF